MAGSKQTRGGSAARGRGRGGGGRSTAAPPNPNPNPNISNPNPPNTASRNPNPNTASRNPNPRVTNPNLRPPNPNSQRQPKNTNRNPNPPTQANSGAPAHPPPPPANLLPPRRTVTGDGVLRIPGANTNRPNPIPQPEGRGKKVAVEAEGHQKKRTKRRLDDGGETSGSAQTASATHSHLRSSSHDSNPASGSVPSHLSPPSQGTSSRTNILPLQYPQRLNLYSPARMELYDEEDEEDQFYEEEFHHEEDEQYEDTFVAAPAFDQQAALDLENLDYQELFERVMAQPGRESLTLLSEDPIPDSIRFTRDRGELVRAIADTFRAKFDGPYYSWSVTPRHIQERYFRSFASEYRWELGLTAVVRGWFWTIATKRMRGIVSQVRTRKPVRKRPTWIGTLLWAEMCALWGTKAAQDKSQTASNSRNSQRNGRGPHKHRSGQSSYLTIQQDMEAELQRPVSYGEVFLKTHTNPDGSFIDKKAEEVAAEYEKRLDAAEQQAGSGGEEINIEEGSLRTSQNLTIEEKNKLFLECTQFDPKGNPYGMGQLASPVEKRKRKRSGSQCSHPQSAELQEALQKATQLLADQAEEKRLRELEQAEQKRLRDLEDKRRDDELAATKTRMTQLENLVNSLLQTNQQTTTPNFTLQLQQANASFDAPNKDAAAPVLRSAAEDDESVGDEDEDDDEEDEDEDDEEDSDNENEPVHN